MAEPLHFYPASFPERPAYDTALGRALLQAVAAGRAPESLRLHRPGDFVAFSGLDRASPGFAAAVDAARSAGFEAVLRLTGGRAAAAHGGALAFSWCVPSADPRRGIGARFACAAGAIVEALQSLGVDAQVGAVPGEYCPGAFSVNAGGRIKLAGLAQRLSRGAAYLGGVIVVTGGGRIRQVLTAVYESLGLPWNPASAGAAEDAVPGLTCEAVAQALRAALQRRRRLVAAEFSPALLREAAAAERAAAPLSPPRRSCG